MSNAVSIMSRLQAEQLLADSYILTQVERLKAGMRYKSDDNYQSFDEHFLWLQNKIDEIPHIALKDSIPVTTASIYTNELISALEEIQDKVEKFTVKGVRFQGDLVTAKSAIDEMSATFEAWYVLAATDLLASTEIKLSATNVKALATSEFNRLMDRSNLAIDALIEAVKVEIKRLSSKAKMAAKKFEMGREQVNAAWLTKLPEGQGFSTGRPQFGVLAPSVADDDLDEEPLTASTFVSRDGGVKSTEAPKKFKVCAIGGAASADEFDTLEEAESFVRKSGDPVRFSIGYPDGSWNHFTPAPREEPAGDAVIEEPIIEKPKGILKLGTPVSATLLAGFTANDEPIDPPSESHHQEYEATWIEPVNVEVEVAGDPLPQVEKVVEVKPAEPGAEEPVKSKVHETKGPVVYEDLDDEPAPTPVPAKTPATETRPQVTTRRKALDLDDVEEPAKTPVTTPLITTGTPEPLNPSTIKVDEAAGTVTAQVPARRARVTFEFNDLD